MRSTEARMVGFCNGIVYLDCYSYSPFFPISQSYLWNTSIGKYGYFCSHCSPYPPRLRVALGFAYHSQSNDFKFVRILCFKGVLGAKPAPAMAEVFTLSTRSHKNLVVSVDSLTRIEPNGSISDIVEDPFLFFNGALHSLAYTTEGNKFILSFDFNDERFREITLPGDYLDGLIVLNLEHLAVFKGSLALIAFGEFEIEMDDDTGIVEICHIWEMKEYGDVKSWTKKIVFVESVNRFFGCTRNGELLIETNEGNQFSVDPENEEEYDLGIQHPLRVAYTTNIMESLLFVDSC
jgi:F-box interacting protein